MMNDALYLNDTWSCYFHNPFDEDWRNESYHKLLDIGSAEEFWTFQNTVGKHVKNGMFFMMREHVFPCWDDPANIHGGCLSVKILKEDMIDFWERLCTKLLTETLLFDEHKNKWNMVNGISTSPKRHFCIVKIWISSPELANIKVFDLPCEYSGEVIYKTNLSNISMENIRINAGGAAAPAPLQELGYVGA
jgi:Eukaryotic initiation factor 4E